MNKQKFTDVTDAVLDKLALLMSVFLLVASGVIIGQFTGPKLLVLITALLYILYLVTMIVKLFFRQEEVDQPDSYPNHKKP